MKKGLLRRCRVGFELLDYREEGALDMLHEKC
jgi:hypothetical protein